MERTNILKGKNVLVTGATGFIGANLVRQLLDIGSQVHVLTRKESDKWRIKGLSAESKDL